MIRDTYPDYRSLQGAEQEGIDYRIEYAVGPSGFAIMAPHGGTIEFLTTELTREAAAEDHSWYSFTGLKPYPHAHRLHITSHRFDLDGANELLWYMLARELRADGFFTSRHWSLSIAGRGFDNICNRGRSGGVQLELPYGLRMRMLGIPSVRRRFLAALRRGIAAYRETSATEAQFHMNSSMQDRPASWLAAFLADVDSYRHIEPL